MNAHELIKAHERAIELLEKMENLNDRIDLKHGLIAEFDALPGYKDRRKAEILKLNFGLTSITDQYEIIIQELQS